MLSFYLRKYIDVELMACMIKLCLPFLWNCELMLLSADILEVPLKKGLKL